MTVQEDGKTEEAGSNEREPKLSSVSAKGLFASLREQGEDVGSTPDPEPRTPPRGRGLGGGIFSPRSGSPASGDLKRVKTTNLNKFLTPSRTFARLRNEKEELSRLTPSPPARGFRDGFKLPLIGEVKPRVLLGLAKEWLRSPKNWALLIWGIAVGISGAILFMVMTGMLNGVLPNKSDRNTWFEVSNQIINALFTLMVLYLQPQRALHLYMLWRWKASDIVKLRNIYCKNGTRKPHEWGHMLVVVLLLELNCVAQYALCGLNWGYRRAQRPAIGVALCLCLSFGGAASAGIYNIVSPLGKDFEDSQDPDDPEKAVLDKREHEFAPRTRIYRMLERRVSFACREEGVLVENPEWKGKVFDITNEPPVSILSTLCCVCVFGWNMERMGFGNRFVHIITFVLICTAPFWIFDLAALNIQNRYVRNAIGGTGIALCAFGLLYGGYWRIRMRERFKLPANKFCCGWPGVTDCFQWLFFPLCSLCQEVRTAEFYDIKDDMFYSRHQYGPPTSPPPGIASPRTPGPTLPAVQEMGEMNLVDVELRGHDSPYRDFQHSRSPLAPPTPVTATRGINGGPRGSPLTMSPLQSSPSSPRSKNPFLNPAAGASNPFVPLHSESPSRTSTTTNPFLQPDVFSKGASPLRSPPISSPYNPFTPSQAELTSQASEALMRSPLRTTHRVGSPMNPFSPPETSSPGPESWVSPLHRASPSHQPLNPPEVSYPGASDQKPPHHPASSPPGPTNPFLQPEAGYSPSESVRSSNDGSSKGRA